ncbi:MAG: hypothetical protein EPN25_02865 [Nitrospirae bacterium]|nr:MAG: hypothetical protein EPN25_02865 [Nitrospirota bacterium]
MKKLCRICKREVPWMVHHEAGRTRKSLRAGDGLNLPAQNDNDAICLPCLEKLNSDYISVGWEIQITYN